MKPMIYLAGPIFGTTGAEANDWRRVMTARLAPHGIVGISPLRCEPLVGDRYDLHYADPCFGVPSAILAKNFLDLRKCDLTLAYLPKPPEVDEMDELILALDCRLSISSDQAYIDTLKRLARKSPQRSIGTIGEISWAYALQKPCAIVSDDPLIQHHPFTSSQPNWRLSTLDEAERLIVGLFADYAK